MPGYFTLARTAQILKRHRGSINRQCIAGKLIGAKKENGNWLIPITTVAALAPHLMDGKSEQPALLWGKTFGDRLRNLRKDKGLTQTELANKLGFKHNGPVSNIENNKISPDIDTLIKIAEIFNADLHWLITGTLPPGREGWESGYYQALKAIAEYAQSQIVIDVASPKVTHD